jgi:hypothetical protein
MAIMIGVIGMGIYLITQGGVIGNIFTAEHVMGAIFIVVGIYFSIKEFREATNTKPQIILNEKGIQTITTEFYEWKDIENEDVEIRGTGKQTKCYLTYSHTDGFENLQIDDYNIEYGALKKLLKVYRGRNMKKSGERSQ